MTCQKLSRPIFYATLAFCLATANAVTSCQAASAAIFGGGPFYSGGTTVMDTLRASKFTTVIIWTLHVNGENGNLVLNDKLIVTDGAYVGNPEWPAQLASLKTEPTSINRIEVGIGSWGVDDFGAVKKLIAAQGTGPNSILYKNFQALKEATGATAINYDDEMLYDVRTAVQLGRMLGRIGYKVALCPYNHIEFWGDVKSQLGNTVDIVYLQCYDGGSNNNPAEWNSALRTKVHPGLWCSRNGGSAGDNPAAVQTKLTAWKRSATMPGAFIWLFDDIQKAPDLGSPLDYAEAIHAALDSSTK